MAAALTPEKSADAPDRAAAQMSQRLPRNPVQLRFENS